MTIEILKKHREEAVLAQFRQLYKNFPQGHHRPAERPDFIVQSTQRLLGVELTQIHELSREDDQIAHRYEARVDQILYMAKKQYDLNEEPDCYISIVFNLEKIAEYTDDDIIARLTTILLRYLPNRGDIVVVDLPSLGLLHDCPFIHRILIYTYPTDSDVGAIFYSPRSLWLSKIGRSHLERSLNAKEKKYPSYREAADEVWLLMELNGYFSANEVYNLEQLCKGLYASSFTKAFVLCSFENRLFELNLQSQGS